MTRMHVMLTLAAVLLAALIWQNGSGGGPAPVARQAASTAALSVGKPAPEVVLSALAAHPLFSPSRLPPPEPEAVPAAVSVPPALPPAPPSAAATPVLQGLVLTPEPGAAYLGEGRDGPSHFLRPGQSALGLTLEKVEPGRAIFQSAAGEVALLLVPAATSLPEAAATPPPDGPAAPQGPDDPNGAAPADPAVLSPDAFAPVTDPPAGAAPAP